MVTSRLNISCHLPPFSRSSLTRPLFYASPSAFFPVLAHLCPFPLARFIISREISYLADWWCISFFVLNAGFIWCNCTQHFHFPNPIKRKTFWSAWTIMGWFYPIIRVILHPLWCSLLRKQKITIAPHFKFECSLSSHVNHFIEFSSSLILQWFVDLLVKNVCLKRNEKVIEN